MSLPQIKNTDNAVRANPQRAQIVRALGELRITLASLKSKTAAVAGCRKQEWTIRCGEIGRKKRGTGEFERRRGTHCIDQYRYLVTMQGQA